MKTCAIAASRSFRSCHGLGVSSSLGSTHVARLVQCCTDLMFMLDSAVAGVLIDAHVDESLASFEGC